MNERIKELALQAKEYATTRHPVSTLVLNVDHYLFEQQFAELIVRECAQVAWQHTPDTEELEYSHLIKDKILANFGVEE